MLAISYAHSSGVVLGVVVGSEFCSFFGEPFWSPGGKYIALVFESSSHTPMCMRSPNCLKSQ